MECGFDVTHENEILKIVVSGNLDAQNAPKLSEELKKHIGKPIKKIIFYAKELEYISSAGLRVIIFAKQKIGVDAEIIMVGAQEDVIDVIKMSGLDNMISLSDSY